MDRIPEKKIHEIIQLRKIGYSIPEISKTTDIPRTTVTRYVSKVSVPDKYRQLLKEKQGGSKLRAEGLRENILKKVKSELGTFSDRDRLFLLIGLYWGEGTKKDFSLINSDPHLLQAVMSSLDSLNIGKDRIDLSLRVHKGISVPKAKMFWSRAIGVPINRIGRIEVIEGKKKGKLPHGMCRVRVRSGIRERLFIQTAISVIGKDSHERVVSK